MNFCDESGIFAGAFARSIAAGEQLFPCRRQSPCSIRIRTGSSNRAGESCTGALIWVWHQAAHHGVELLFGAAKPADIRYGSLGPPTRTSLTGKDSHWRQQQNGDPYPIGNLPGKATREH